MVWSDHLSQHHFHPYYDIHFFTVLKSQIRFIRLHNEQCFVYYLTWSIVLLCPETWASDKVWRSLKERISIEI